MSADLVERLREAAKLDAGDVAFEVSDPALTLYGQAAAEIERLRALIEETKAERQDWARRFLLDGETPAQIMAERNRLRALSAPQGVPREPTREMCEAGWRAWQQVHPAQDVRAGLGYAYKAMIAALSPSAQGAETGLSRAEKMVVGDIRRDAKFREACRDARAQGAEARDAERYRWLRQFIVTGEHLTGKHEGKIAVSGDHEGLDDLIDSALKRAREQEER